MKRILVAATASLLLCLIAGCAAVALLAAAFPLKAWHSGVLPAVISTLVFAPIMTAVLLRIWDVYFYGARRPAGGTDRPDGRGEAWR